MRFAVLRSALYHHLTYRTMPVPCIHRFARFFAAYSPLCILFVRIARFCCCVGWDVATLRTVLYALLSLLFTFTWQHFCCRVSRRLAYFMRTLLRRMLYARRCACCTCSCDSQRLLRFVMALYGVGSPLPRILCYAGALRYGGCRGARRPSYASTHLPAFLRLPFPAFASHFARTTSTVPLCAGCLPPCNPCCLAIALHISCFLRCLRLCQRLSRAHAGLCRAPLPRASRTLPAPRATTTAPLYLPPSCLALALPCPLPAFTLPAFAFVPSPTPLPLPPACTYTPCLIYPYHLPFPHCPSFHLAFLPTCPTTFPLPQVPYPLFPACLLPHTWLVNLHGGMVACLWCLAALVANFLLLPCLSAFVCSPLPLFCFPHATTFYFLCTFILGQLDRTGTGLG